MSGFTQTPEIRKVACASAAWAECLRYMFAGYGASVTRSTVLRHFGQSEACMPVYDLTRLRQAAGAWTDDDGREFLVNLTEFGVLDPLKPTASVVQAVMQRLERQPVFCGAAGHVSLITEMSTLSGPSDRVSVEHVMVRDPYQRGETLRRLSIDELSHPFYLLGLSIRPIGMTPAVWEAPLDRSNPNIAG